MAALFFASRAWKRRDTPSADPALAPGQISAGHPISTTGGNAAVTNNPPQIENFTADAMGDGWFVVSGTVIDEHPGGLTITFGGDVDSMYGRTTTTDVNGNFSLLVCLNTDGTDMGWLTAVTRDDAGQSSNEASVYVDP